jgi:protein-disulfide isomerase
MRFIIFKAESMKHLTKIILLGLTALPLAFGGLELVNAQAKTNWLLTFTSSAKGGHIIGNPAAVTKVVEYASYTCGHCGEFEVNDAPTLKNQYVAGGKVSFEIRNLVRDPLDLTAAMLARCGGKGRFFGNHSRLMATQGQWANDSKLSKATQAKWEAENVTGFMQAAYTELGLSTIMQARGITAVQAKACLADKASLDQILAMTSEATGPLGLTGTPSFLVNGKVVKAHGLAELKSYLK